MTGTSALDTIEASVGPLPPVVILAGGRGARFDHESQVLPKPLIGVAGRPILRHIVDGFVAQGFREFIVLTGHLGIEIDLYLARESRSWTVLGADRSDYLYTLPGGFSVRTLDTGIDSGTGTRVWMSRAAIGERDFVLTYGDGLCDVDMRGLIATHRHMRQFLDPLVTVTAVNPPGRFGVIEMVQGTGYSHYRQARSFSEKPRTDQWINGGFMFVDRRFMGAYLGDGIDLESAALQAAARAGDLFAHLHGGYWRCMDTRRDLEQIEADVAAAGGRLPWIPAAAG